MSARHDIEIGFDQEMGFFHAIWRPPTAIGAGNSILEALRDLRKAVEFCADHHVEGKFSEIRKEV